MRRRPTEINANLTPMIDVVFLLIVFFVLVSRLVDFDSVAMDLPRPTDAATERPEDEARLVINVVPGPEGSAIGYKMQASVVEASPQGAKELVKIVREQLIRQPIAAISLRADRATRYRYVSVLLSALEAMDRNGLEAPIRLNLVIVNEEAQ
jgi:biopolymer transport protein ExbD